MRLIDADVLIAHIKDEIEECKPPYCGRGNGKSIAYGTVLGLKSAIAFAEALATIEAEPVVHGEWIFKHNPIEDPKGYFIRIVCSECNLHTGQKSNYCPNCGAKTKGAKDE